MKNMKLILAIVTVFITTVLFAQTEPVASNKRIVVLGSSMAAGWVTSYQEKYDMQNGYAYRLARYMQPNGWEVVNKSIPGINTKEAISLFRKEVLPLKPGYVFIGLSMSNEGLEKLNPDTVSVHFEKGIKTLIGLCVENHIKPVLGLCYSNNNYTREQYQYVQKMNLKMNTWGVPCVNLLGAIDDNNGHFPEELTFDPNHPMDRGHEEFFLAFTPDLFDAMTIGKSIPTQIGSDQFLKLGLKTGNHLVSYIPSAVMHSFSFGFSVKAKTPGLLAKIETSVSANRIVLNKDGYITYGPIVSKTRIDKRKSATLFLTHSYLYKKTTLYLDGVNQGECTEQLEPVIFILGNHPKEAEYANLMIFRGALNQEEVASMAKGNWLHASLEVYSPLDKAGIKGDQIINHALSVHSAKLNDPANGLAKSELIQQIEQAKVARENELKVEHKKAISVNPEIFDQLVGKYEIAPGDNFIIEKADNKLYFVDRGEKTELYPESEIKYFIKHPADLTVTFQKDESGKVTGMEFSMNGRGMKTKKID